MKLPNEIYLFEGGDGVVWCDTDESDCGDGAKYIRADLVSEDRTRTVEEAYSEAIAVQDYWDSDMVSWFINKTKEESIREHIRKLYQEFKQLESKNRLKPKQTLNDIKKQAIKDAINYASDKVREVIPHLKGDADLVSSENLKQYANGLKGEE